MRALFVDYGGVLTTSVWDAFGAFEQREGLDPGAVKALFRSNPAALALLRRMEAGEIDHESFAENFAPLLRVAPEGLIDRLFAGMGPDHAMLEAVRRAHVAGVPTGLISNSWGAGLPYDRELLAELFDVVVISGEVGLHKPEPEIFLLAARRLGVEPADCVFVDDLRENCEGAEAVGMTAVLHRGAAGTLTRLDELLGLDLAEALH